MAFLSIFALSGVLLVNPPIQLDWATSKIRIGAEGSAIEQRCGIEMAEILAVRAKQIPTAGMSKEDRERYEAAVEGLSSGFEEAEDRERARLLLQLMESTNSQRTVSQAWVLLAGLPISYLYVFDGSTGSVLFRFEDEVTGVYIAYSDQPKEMAEWEEDHERIKELSATKDPERRKALAKEINDRKSGRETHFEVNGAVITLNSNDPEYEAESRQAFADLLRDLPPGDGRKRLGRAISIVWRAMVDKQFFEAFSVRFWPSSIHPKSLVPLLDTCLTDNGIHFTDGRFDGGLLNYAAPPDEVLEVFFGDAPLPMPDPALTAKELAKKYR